MNENDHPEGKARKPGEVDPAVQSQIGAKLREMYGDVLSQPVPDRFLTLLKKLEEGNGKDE